MTDENEKLKNILRDHKIWLDLMGGRRADFGLYGIRYLECANFQALDLREAIFKRVWLAESNFSEACLGGADFRDANLVGADFTNADLRGANFFGANLKNAKLKGAKTEDAIGLNLACPSEGTFTAWKKADGKLVKLLIPSDAKRSSATTSKCRSDKAIVLGIYTLEGEETQETNILSDYDPTFVYTVGNIVYADSFDEDRFNECSHGIHFFIDRTQAAQY